MVTIDLTRDGQLTPQARELLESFYMLKGEKSPQEAYARAAVAYSAGDAEFAQRIYDYASKGWFMFASPLLSNAPAPGAAWRALPISCYLSYVPDTLEGLIDHTTELRWLSVLGGGIGGHWSAIRSVSNKSPGPVPFLKTVDADMTAYQQGTTRKGSYAAYLDISHPDVLEFLQIRTPTGGDPNRKCFNLFTALNIPDAFWEAALDNKDWNLVDPHDGSARETVKARLLLEQVVETRFRTGTPYILNIDAAQRGLPESQKKLGLKINGSNLCIEIVEATSPERTAVCCLSSVNLALYDDWCDHPTFIADMIRMLDNALQVFIDNATDAIAKARYSAMQERSLGLGAMGFHSYLQKHMIPWESALAKSANLKIFRKIKTDALAASRQLAVERGAYLDGPDTGVRNAHLLAIAPNANSGIILGVSPSVEPWKSNAYTHKTRAGSHQVRNPYLAALLEQRIPDEQEREDVWSSITVNGGSVRHIDALNDWEKSVFATAFEIDQRWVVEHAADRQQFICQSQSINLFFPENSNRRYVLETHIKAWKSGMKSLYYLRTQAGVEADKVSQTLNRIPLKDYANQEECLACQG